MIPNVALAGIRASQFGQLTSTPVLPGGYSVAALAIPTADCSRQQAAAATQASRLTMVYVLPTASQHRLSCGATGVASCAVRPVPNNGDQGRSIGDNCGGDDHAHIVLRNPLPAGADYRAHTGVVLRGGAQLVHEVMSVRDHRLGIGGGHPVLVEQLRVS